MLLDMCKEFRGTHNAREPSINATLRERTYISESQQIGEPMIHATRSLIEVGVSRIDGNPIPDGKPKYTADIIGIRIDATSAMEKQRMMADDELATQLMGFFDDSLGDIKAGKNTTDLRMRITALEASIVIRFLQLTWSHRLDRLENLLCLH